jgi:hypothetical protein
MGIVSRAADTYYTYKFIRLLTTDWEDLEAYEYGIVDENGKVLRKSRELSGRDEKSAYTLFHRLVFSIKRLLEKFPGGKTVVGRYAAALFLIKETTGMSDEQIGYVLDKIGISRDELQLSEAVEERPWFMLDNSVISPGVYTLVNEISSPLTGEPIAETNTHVVVDENTTPVGSIFGADIYSVRHKETHQQIYITSRDIKR